MRRYAKTLFPIAASLVLSVILTSPVRGQQEDKIVKIDITCKGGSGRASASVKPETVDVDQDQNIIWKLKINNSNRNDLSIEPKKPGLWPYESEKHGGQGEAKTTKMKPNAKGIYEYKIRYKCDDTDYLIDPRVRVGGDG